VLPDRVLPKLGAKLHANVMTRELSGSLSETRNPNSSTWALLKEVLRFFESLERLPSVLILLAMVLHTLLASGQG
jgi:hypothetical protein